MVTRDIFIIGHGGYNERRGTTNVPASCEVRFYVPQGDVMNAGLMRSMLRDASIKCGEADSGTVAAVEVFAAMQAVPNMKLGPLHGTVEADKNSFMMGRPALKRRNIAALLLSPRQNFLLGDLMGKVMSHKKNAGVDGFRFHWLCCRSVTVPKSKVQAPKASPQGAADDPFAGLELAEW